MTHRTPSDARRVPGSSMVKLEADAALQIDAVPVKREPGLHGRDAQPFLGFGTESTPELLDILVQQVNSIPYALRRRVQEDALIPPGKEQLSTPETLRFIIQLLQYQAPSPISPPALNAAESVPSIDETRTMVSQAMRDLEYHQAHGNVQNPPRHKPSPQWDGVTNHHRPSLTTTAAPSIDLYNRVKTIDGDRNPEFEHGFVKWFDAGVPKQD